VTVLKWWRFHCLLLAAYVGVSLLLALPKRCHAQEEPSSGSAAPAESEAADLFGRAESAFADADYGRAAQLFLLADEKAPHASVMYNAAVSWDYAGKRAQAADCYQTALERDGLTTQQQTQAEHRLDELGKYLGLVHVAKPVGGLASIDRIERRPIPFQFFQEPGSYQVELETATGAATTTDITVLPGQTLRLELNPVETQARVTPTVTRRPDAGSRATRPLQPVLPPMQERPSHAQEVVGWVGVGLGVLAAGVATYYGLQTLQKRDVFDDSDSTDADAREDGMRAKTRANIAWVSSAVTSVTGLTLVLTSPTFRF
jgi:hypothetical protein